MNNMVAKHSVKIQSLEGALEDCKRRNNIPTSNSNSSVMNTPGSINGNGLFEPSSSNLHPPCSPSTGNSVSASVATSASSSSLQMIDSLQGKLLKEMTVRQELEQTLTVNTHKLLLLDEELKASQLTQTELHKTNEELSVTIETLQVSCVTSLSIDSNTYTEYNILCIHC